MIYVLIGILILGAISCFYANEKENNDKKSVLEPDKTHLSEIEQTFSENENLTFPQKLNKTKDLYPFKNWREAFFEYDMKQYTEENCNTAKTIFDNLITGLIELGENGNEKSKIALFEKAVNSLNDLANKVKGLIETGEREDLCELIDQITVASGLDPEDYADGEGLADLWRDW